MKLRFIDPNQILGIILALIILAVGVFAAFTVFANIPTTVPVGSNQNNGNGTIYNVAALNTNVTYFIPTPGFLNNTGVCTFWTYGVTGTAGGYVGWHVNQTVGACNGTFIANGTYRVSRHSFRTHNSSLRLEYAFANQQTTSLQNTTYFSVINVSRTSTQVFNIIGIVMIIAAIMSIVGLVYSYIRPGMGAK